MKCDNDSSYSRRSFISRAGSATFALPLTQSIPRSQYRTNALRTQANRPKIPWPELDFTDLSDTVIRREKEPIFGHVRSLTSFATVELSQITERYPPPSEDYLSVPDSVQEQPPLRILHLPRREIDYIVPDGKEFPDEVLLLPEDEDAAVLEDGTIVIGRVTLTASGWNLGGRPVKETEIRLISLEQDSQSDSQSVENTGRGQENIDQEEQIGDKTDIDDDVTDNGSTQPDRTYGCWVGDIRYTIRDAKQAGNRAVSTKRSNWDVNLHVNLRETPDLEDQTPAQKYGVVDRVFLELEFVRYSISYWVKYEDLDSLDIPPGPGPAICASNFTPLDMQGAATRDNIVVNPFTSFPNRAGYIEYINPEAFQGLEERIRKDWEETLKTSYPDIERDPEIIGEVARRQAEEIRQEYGNSSSSYGFEAPQWSRGGVETIKGVEYPTGTMTNTCDRGHTRVREYEYTMPEPDSVTVGYPRQSGIQMEDPQIPRLFKGDQSRMEGGYVVQDEYDGTFHTRWNLTRKESCAIPDSVGNTSDDHCATIEKEIQATKDRLEQARQRSNELKDQLDILADESQRLAAQLAEQYQEFLSVMIAAGLYDLASELLGALLSDRLLKSAYRAGRISKESYDALSKARKIPRKPITGPEDIANLLADELLPGFKNIRKVAKTGKTLTDYIGADDGERIINYIENSSNPAIEQFHVDLVKSYVSTAQAWAENQAETGQKSTQATQWEAEIINQAGRLEELLKELEKCREENPR